MNLRIAQSHSSGLYAGHILSKGLVLKFVWEGTINDFSLTLFDCALVLEGAKLGKKIIIAKEKHKMNGKLLIFSCLIS